MKKTLSERDICTKFITPAVVGAGWDLHTQIREEVTFGIQAQAAGGAQPFVSLSFLRNVPVPLPPLAEQHRIVAKVDDLMSLCDRLKSDSAESRIRQARLATTLIETALMAV